MPALLIEYTAQDLKRLRKHIGPGHQIRLVCGEDGWTCEITAGPQQTVIWETDEPAATPEECCRPLLSNATRILSDLGIRPL